MTHLLGLDIGTTGCKATLFDLQGRLVSAASHEYFVQFPKPGWAEQDAELVWDLAQQVMREVTYNSGQRNVAAIGLSVQGEAITPVDAKGNALRPMILGMDTRTVEQNQWLEDKFGKKRLFEKTGMPIHTINTLPKLLWLREFEPQLWKEAERFMLYEDFLIRKMTGESVVSRCLASRTQLYSHQEDGWSVEVLEALDLDQKRLSVIADSGFAVGRLHRKISDAIGFAEPPMVVTGGHDQSCGAFGVGLTQPGLASVSTGTAEVVEVALASPNVSQPLFEGNISVYAHVYKKLYVTMTLNHSGGLLFRWFRDTFGQEEIREAQTSGEDAYQLLLANAPEGPTNLLVLPHFSGSGTPTFDTASKGAILGMGFTTSKAEMAKAILEGLTYELRLNLDVMRSGGVQIDELRAIGGGAKSGLWLQLKADITGTRVVVPQVTEAASMGAAFLAGQGAGLFADAGEAVNQYLRFGKVFEPDSRRVKQYEEKFALYSEVYPTLKSLHHRM